MSKLKLQKLLQQIGYSNRRNIRQWINEGRFAINGQAVTLPGHPVDPVKDKVAFEGKKIQLRLQPLVYYVMNKPTGVVCTLSDPQKRPTITDYLCGIRERVYPVGRLDFHSEGLLLLTNDGDLANFVISPRNKIPKTYEVKIKGTLSEEVRKNLLTKGLFMDGIRVRPVKIEQLKRTEQNNSWLMVVIYEGKKHVIRNLFKYSGHPVEKLKRTAIGTLRLKKLPRGEWRPVPPEDIMGFKKKYNFLTGKED